MDIIGILLVSFTCFIPQFLVLVLFCVIGYLDNVKISYSGLKKISPEEVHEVAEVWRYRQMSLREPLRMPDRAAVKSKTVVKPDMQKITSAFIKRSLN
jgi:hypothetical protein